MKMHHDRFSLSLRVRHPTLSTDRIGEILKMDPAFGRDVGEFAITPKGNKLDFINKETYCYFELSHGNESLDFELSKKIETMKNLEEKIKIINDGGGTLEIYVGIFSKKELAFTLSKKAISQMAIMEFSISVEYY